SCPTPGVDMAGNLARLDLRGVAIFAKNFAKDSTDLPEGRVAARRLEHGVHEVAVALGRGPYALQRHPRRGAVAARAQLGHGRPLCPLRSVVNLQRRDRGGRARRSVPVDADDGPLAAVDLALGPISRAGNLTLGPACLDRADDAPHVIDGREDGVRL